MEKKKRTAVHAGGENTLIEKMAVGGEVPVVARAEEVEVTGMQTNWDYEATFFKADEEDACHCVGKACSAAHLYDKDQEPWGVAGNQWTLDGCWWAENCHCVNRSWVKREGPRIAVITVGDADAGGSAQGRTMSW